MTHTIHLDGCSASFFVFRTVSQIRARLQEHISRTIDIAINLMLAIVAHFAFLCIFCIQVTAGRASTRCVVLVNDVNVTADQSGSRNQSLPKSVMTPQLEFSLCLLIQLELHHLFRLKRR